MPSATLDSNVYISALVFRQKAERILHLAIDQGVDIAISDDVLNEVLRVLHEKFGWDRDRLTAKELDRSMSQLMRICLAIADKILRLVTVLEIILRKHIGPASRWSTICPAIAGAYPRGSALEATCLR